MSNHIEEVKKHLRGSKQAGTRLSAYRNSLEHQIFEEHDEDAARHTDFRVQTNFMRASIENSLAYGEASIAIAEELHGIREQLRIANLIAIGALFVDEMPETGERGLIYLPADDVSQAPDIAEALGIGGESDD